NAREAIPEEGSVVVTAGPAELSPADCLELLGDARPGPCVAVTVVDTGGGLTPEAWARLAEPFFTTKPRHPGLRRASPYGRLAGHGGCGRGRGPGGGRRACLYLPAAAAADGRPARPEPEPLAGRGERVQVVDDDPLVRQMVCTTLERAGYRVQAAGDGVAA